MSKSVEAPPIKVIKELSLPGYETEVLPNGMPLYMLKGGSEPEVKFSNLEKESSILEDEESGEDEEEELSDAEFNMSELNGFLEKSNNERSQSV